VSADLRGWRIALIADALLNAGPGAPLPDVIAVLEASSYGVLQLPPAGGAHGLLLAVTADQVAEYAHHGYAVVAIGLKGQAESGLHWRRLTSLLRQRNSALPPRHVIAPKMDAGEEARRLAAFLDSYDIPEDEKRRWRV
jgi:hypothetical protein